MAENEIEAGGKTNQTKNVGAALAVMGGALTVLVITAPIGIPMFIAGIYLWWKHR